MEKSAPSSINWKLTVLGSSLACISLLAPMLIGVKEFGIIPLMEESIVRNSSGLLLVASLRLVVLNTIRALPLYTGVLLTAEGLGLFRSRAPITALLPVLFIPASYEIIRKVYGITYDFGIPAIAMTLSILLFSKMQDMARHLLHKIVIFSLLLFGLEWLDIVPRLSGLWFGRGEISTDIKLIASFLHAQDVLNITGLALCSIFVINAFITARLLSVYTREIQAVEQARKLEQLAAQLSLQSLENRSLREMQSLVHDLKTPLTTIQGLADVIAISETSDSIREYARYISDTGNKMNTMISELLKDGCRQVLPAADLVTYTVAHLPQLNQLPGFSLSLPESSPMVAVNKVQMSRAISNILENALQAVGIAGHVSVILGATEGYAVLSVADDGPGIAAEHLDHIWEVGFSTKSSSGIGLSFVREVIEKNGGTISVSSNPGKGTMFTIKLPEAIAA